MEIAWEIARDIYDEDDEIFSVGDGLTDELAHKLNMKGDIVSSGTCNVDTPGHAAAWGRRLAEIFFTAAGESGIMQKVAPPKSLCDLVHAVEDYPFRSFEGGESDIILNVPYRRSSRKRSRSSRFESTKSTKQTTTYKVTLYADSRDASVILSLRVTTTQP